MPDRDAPPVVTLTTDFGLSDAYVGIMKGIILSIAPHAQIVDITHNVAPQNIREASAKLETAVAYFPAHTLHVAVVDPGVGTARNAVVVETETCRFVAPDNGLLTLPLHRVAPVRVIRLNEKAIPYLRHPVSATFQGRDVFAPIAAHLVQGVLPETLGEEISPAELATWAVADVETFRNAQGQSLLRVPVLYADHFGNLITDLTYEQWADWLQNLGEIMEDATRRVWILAGETRWQSLARTFAEAPVGAPLAYWGSAGRLEVAVRDGSAAAALSLAPGERITLTL